MSSIFISHSSSDNAIAQDLERRLTRQGHSSVFLDLDPEKGIVGGQSWERTLYRKIRACRAVIALITDDFDRKRANDRSTPGARLMGLARKPRGWLHRALRSDAGRMRFDSSDVEHVLRHDGGQWLVRILDHRESLRTMQNIFALTVEY